MDLYNVATELFAHPWAPWIGVYLGFVAIMGLLAYYFFGWDGVGKVALTIGLPVTIVAWIFRRAWDIITYPFFLRKKRLLGDTFGFYNWGEEEYRYEHGQSLVNSTLTGLALAMDYRFQQQEERQRMKILDLDLDRQVKDAKDDFWNAWNLARSCYFGVKSNYRDYLPRPVTHYESPSVRHATVYPARRALSSGRDIV